MAHAQAASAVRFDMQSQSMSAALRSFGRTTHAQIIFNADNVRGLVAPAIHEILTPDAALSRLLAGTHLAFNRTGDNVYVVRPSEIAEQESPVPTDDILVTANLVRLSAMRVPTRIKDIPQSVSVITQDTLREQNATSLDDALKWATGITLQPGNTGTDFLIRGFVLDSIHVDGGAGRYLSSPTLINNQDLSAYDSVEVLRGPDALFGGYTSPAGSVNLVRKRPLDRPQVTAIGSIGSWDNLSGTIDATGPLTSDGKLRARIVASRTQQDFFYDDAHQRSSKIYAIVDYSLTPKARLSIGGSYQRQSATPFAGLPRFLDGSDPLLPRSTSLLPDWAGGSQINKELFSKFEYFFSKRTKLTVDAARTWENGLLTTAPVYSGINPATGLSNVFYSSQTNDAIRQDTLDATLTSSFDWHGLEQSFVVGADYSATHDEYSAYIGRPTRITIDPYNFNAQTLGRPNYSIFDDQSTTNTKTFGYYASVKIKPIASLSFIAGARRTHNSAEQSSTYYDSEFKIKTDPRITPFYGATLELSKNASAYISYADSFSPNYGYSTVSGKVIPDSSGRNIEVGLKYASKGDAVGGSIAYFNTRKNNMIQFDDSADPALYGVNGCCYVYGSYKSSGIELEIYGKVTSNLKVNAGYTYNKNDITLDGLDPSYRNITPRHLFRLWFNYSPSFLLKGLDIGGGVSAQSGTFRASEACSEIEAATGNCITYTPFQIRQGTYAVATARVGYKIGKDLTAALSINNLTNARYFARIGSSQSGNVLGAPRNFMFTLSFTK